MLKKSVLVAFAMICPFLIGAQEEGGELCQQKLAPKVNICGWKVCAFDIDFETVFLRRTRVSKTVDFSSEEIQGPIVLSSKDLDFGWEYGYRIMGEVFFDNCDRLEFSYLDMAEWSDTAKARSQENLLYSAFSDFGTQPFQGFPDTGQGSLHKIDYRSKLKSFEANFHNHLTIFQIPCFCCLDGSYLFGYRYIDLDESFKFKTVSTLNDGRMDYKISSSNKMHGVQAGAEVWLPITECLDIGAVLKGAFYVNCTEQKTRIHASHLLDPLHESKDSLWYALGLEAAVKASYEILPGLYVRGTYQTLYFDRLTLAVENFNKKNPFDEENKRKKKLDQDGHVAYHGFSIGIDWCW